MNVRPLPWREDVDPYHIWISEVMLQQTRVETVKPYYQRWMERFPQISSIANADLQEVLKTWEGLGYYSRARNIWKAAGLIRANYGGKLPETLNELMLLPGIGRSTAGALASIAYEKDVAVLDGNIKRVLARVFNFQEPVNLAKNEKELWRLIEKILPHGKAGIFNQAIMELGEMICLPKNPRCSDCPLNTECLAYKVGNQIQLPKRQLKGNLPQYIVVAAVLEKNCRVLITQRPMEKLLGGLWEFPGGKVETGESLKQALHREIREELNIHIDIADEFGVYRHAYTHFKVVVHGFFCQWRSGQMVPTEAPQVAWVRYDQLDDFPMGKVDRMIARDVVSNSCQPV